MSLALNKILIADANANSTAAYFTAGSEGLTNAANVVLAAGAYIFYPTVNVAVQVNKRRLDRVLQPFSPTTPVVSSSLMARTCVLATLATSL
jgi:hypothetical protein